MILTSMAVKAASKAGGELVVAVSDEEPEAVVGVVEVHVQIACDLGEPGSGRVGGDAEDVYPTGGVLDDEERVEPVQGDRVEVEQVAGEDRLGLRFEELCPGRSGPSRRGVDSGGVQDFPDGGGADLVAEVGELAVDPPGLHPPWARGRPHADPDPRGPPYPGRRPNPV